MSFWARQINPDTGLPFKSEGEFNARVNLISTRNKPAVDLMFSVVEKYFPESDRNKVREALTRYMAGFENVPSDPNELKRWGRQFLGSLSRFKRDDFLAQAEAAGWTNEARRADPDGFTKWHQQQIQEDRSVWGANNTSFDSNYGGIIPNEGGMVLQGEEDAVPGSVTGTSQTDGDDPTTRLKAYYDALYNEGTASKIAAMAGGQARKSQRGRGIRGGLADYATAGAVNRGLEGYDQATNAQALQYMGMDQGVAMQQAQLEQQARMFNAQQMSLASQNAYNQRAQLGGTIGGIAGGIVGGVIQGFTGAPVAGAFTAGGTALGSLASSGAAPGAYTVRSSGSLRNASTGSRGGSGGNRDVY